MELFNKRPLALACFFFLLTIPLSFYLDAGVKLYVFLGVLVLFAVFAILFVRLKRARNAFLPVSLSLLFVAAALVSTHFAFDIGFHDLQKHVGTTGEITAVVKSIYFRENYASYLDIGVSEINGEKVDTNMKMECSYRFPFEEGEHFSAKVGFSALEDDINGYREKMNGVSKGQSLIANSDETDDLVFIGEAETDLLSFAKKLNSELDALLSDAIGEGSSGLSRALLLGNRDAIEKRAERDIRHVGVSHLLALSGMHLGIVIGNIGLFLLAFGMPKKPRIIILLLITLAYVILTGVKLSMVRSALMFLITCIGFFAGRERDPVTSLFLSVTVICALYPMAFFDVGLELSFLSMFGIVIFAEPLQKFYARIFKKIKNDFVYLMVNYICTGLSVTFVAALSVLPAVWLYFGETSILVFLGNLIFTPFVTLILFLSPFVIIFCKIPLLGTAAAFAVGKLSDIMLDVCAFLAKGRGVMVSLRYPFAPYVIFGALAVFVIMLAVRIGKKWTLMLPAAAGVAAFALCLAIYTNIHAGELNAVYVSDKSNEGFAVMSDGDLLLCDISTGSYSFTALLIHAGKEMAACDVDTYMLTHYHTRNIGTLRRLCDEIYVRDLLLPKPSSNDEREIALSLEEIAKENGIEVAFYDSAAMDETAYRGINIDTFPRTLIKRSVQPVIALSFFNDNARLTYVGSSVHESGLYELLLPVVQESDAVVFGVHGPNIKSAFSYGKLSPKLKIALFANAGVTGAVDGSDADFASSLGRAETVTGASRYHFVFD